MSDPQKRLRIATRQALRELEYLTFGEVTEQALRRARREHKNAPRPWSLSVVEACLDALRSASEDMGDHSMWNRGGQGYRAVKLLSEYEASCKTFTLRLATTAIVKTVVSVRAPDLETAKLLAVRPDVTAEVVWEYDGLQEENEIEVT